MLRKNDGAAAIEFAIILPVLLLFVFAILQYSVYMFTSMAVSAGTESGARIGATGMGGAHAARLQNIRTDIERFTAGLVAPGDIAIDYKAYTSFDNIGQPEPCSIPVCDENTPPGSYTDINGNGQWDPDQGRSDLGGAGDVVVYNVTVPIPIFNVLPAAYNFLPDNGIITARAAVRNEPF